MEMTKENLNIINKEKEKVSRWKTISLILALALFIVSFIAAIEFNIIQDMARDLKMTIKMYNQEKHQLNALLATQTIN